MFGFIVGLFLFICSVTLVRVAVSFIRLFPGSVGGVLTVRFILSSFWFFNCALNISVMVLFPLWFCVGAVHVAVVGACVCSVWFR